MKNANGAIIKIASVILTGLEKAINQSNPK
jgi:hypothetical protein